jgi:very-short-patch-repair endonuclease
VDITDYLNRHGGVARAGQLKSAGFTRTAVKQAVALGILIPARRGVYATPAPGVLTTAVASGGRLTCVSAAPVYGLWTLNKPASVHVSRSHPSNTPGLKDHGRPTHPRHAWLPVVGLADVLLHALHCLPEFEALVMVQSAVGGGNISLEFLFAKCQGRRNGKARSVLEQVIPRADSLLEVLANAHFARAGLRVRRHVFIPGVGEVDFLVEDCLVVETDGSTHFEPRSVKRDQRRNNRSIIDGYLVLRYYYDDVVHAPEVMVAEVQAVLKLWRGGRYPAGPANGVDLFA